MLMFDRRLISHFDWGLLLLTAVLTGIGLATVLSATYVDGHPFSSLATRQLLWAAGGVGVLFATLLVDYRRLEQYAYPIYGVALFILLLVPYFGTEGGGARRWIAAGPISIQPSELMKVALIAALARHLHTRAWDGALPLRSAAIPALLIGVPALVVREQPDLGTALLLIFAGVTLLIVAGLRLRWFAFAAAVIGPFLPLVWSMLQPYQKRRVLTFLDPQADPLGAGYHIIQSKIAIGSGMLHGKGYLRGTQNHLNFLPEQHTDFIFSVFAEEWGFVGGAVLLGLYALLLIRCLLAATRAKDGFGLLLAVGLTAIVFWQVAVNIGMASGLLPVVGMTLPFLSYGGSSLLAMMLAIGLIMNVSMRRFTF